MLIVEDDLASSQVLGSFFTQHGQEVSEAGTVAEGLALLDSPPDSLILDLMLPDGQGEAVLQKVREEDLPTRVVLITTGVSDPLRRMEVAKLKPDYLLQKPIDADILFRLCEKASS